MSNSNKSFLEILGNYFGKLDETDIIDGKKGRVRIPIEWIFTEKLDRTVIERAMADLLRKGNKAYESNLKFRKQDIEKIDSFEIDTNGEKTDLIINGRDGWTKALVSKTKQKSNPIFTVSEEQFYKEILKIFNLEKIDRICNELELSKDERKNLVSIFKSSDSDAVTLDGIGEAMVMAAKNLTEYYQYINGEMKNASILQGIIQQRKDEGISRGNIGRGASPRISPIYDFTERAKILEEMNPSQIVNIDSIDEEEHVSKFAYTVYVYENPREKDGHLFVAEPLEGSHTTRIRFVPRDEFEALETTENKFVHICQEFLEMSPEEFRKSKFSKSFMHNDITSMRDRLRRIILGEEPQNTQSRRKLYAEIDDILYNGTTKASKSDIANMVKDVTKGEMAQVERDVNGIDGNGINVLEEESQADLTSE